MNANKTPMTEKEECDLALKNHRVKKQRRPIAER